MAAVVAIACIPDLPALPPSPDGPLAPVGPYCGDGIIQLDAGEHCDPGDTGVATLPGCSPSCQIECPNGFVYLDHCYYRAGDQVSLQNASSACQNQSGYALTIESADEWDFVVDAAPFGAREPFWIGLAGSDSTIGYAAAGGVDKPGWRQGICSGCYAEDVDGAAPLPVFPGFPANTFGCVVGDKADTDTWFGVPCFLPLPDDAGLAIKPHVICERDPPGSYADPNCTPGGFCFTLPATYPGKRYEYFSQAQSWDVAASYCAGLKGSLLVVQTRDEREELWEALLKLPSAPLRIWLGLTFDGSANVWTWDDGVNADDPDGYPEPWGVNQPAELPPRGAGAIHAYDFDRISVVDTQLAVNGQLASAAFVCEFRQ